MKYKRSYVIDKKFQYGKSLRLVGAVTVIIAVVILAVGLLISINNRKTGENNKLIISNIENINTILDLQQSIYLKFLMIPTGVDEKTFSKIALTLTKDYNYSTRSLNATSASNQEIIISNNKIIRTNTYLILAVILITITGLVILFIRLVRYTHRISGPIYIMSMYAKEILNGGKPVMRDLRENDEFTEFYDLFRQMGEKIIQQENSGNKKDSAAPSKKRSKAVKK